jgi:hypothetical protein
MARFGTGVPSFYLNDPSDNDASANDGSSIGHPNSRSRYVERLTNTLPNQLNTVLFFTSG